MVNLHSHLQGSMLFSSKDTNAAAAVNSQSVAGELPEGFALTLEQLGIDPSSIKLTFNTGSGQTTGTSQGSIVNSTGSSGTTDTAPTVAQLGLYALVPQTPVNVAGDTAGSTETAATANITSETTTASSSSSSPFEHWYADDATDDAYWSQQPAAVQQLREIQDPEKRQALAEQLASQGYTIDNAIMVWGWDAGQTIAARQSDGYTWVPAANQANVTAAPGVTGPGITPYDPNHAPAGSIPVPTAAT